MSAPTTIHYMHRGQVARVERWVTSQTEPQKYDNDTARLVRADEDFDQVRVWFGEDDGLPHATAEVAR